MISRIKTSLIALIICIAWFVKIDIALAQSNNLGKEFYLENCTTCHIPIPAEVLPTERWQEILNNTDNHYGEVLPTSVKVTARLMWAYLRRYSRPALPEETLPKYVTNSRYLKALHPQVELPTPTNHQSCTLCHPMAAKLDYRTLRIEN